MCIQLQVVVAGTSEQVEEALATAAEYKDKLQERGVLVVPLPIYESSKKADKQNSIDEKDLK